MQVNLASFKKCSSYLGSLERLILQNKLIQSIVVYFTSLTYACATQELKLVTPFPLQLLNPKYIFHKNQSRVVCHLLQLLNFDLPFATGRDVMGFFAGLFVDVAALYHLIEYGNL